MSSKTLRASLYFLGAVTALYLLVTLTTDGGEEVTASNSGLAAALAAIDGEQLARVEFTDPSGDILLVKEGGRWTVNGYEADTAVVNRFLRAVDTAEVQEVVSANPDNHESMHMNSDSARKMVADGGVAILFGKHAKRSRTGFARLPGSDTVHFVHGDLRYTVGRSEFEWRNKVMLQTDTSAVETIRVTRDGATTVYERDALTWMVNGEEADPSTVRNTIRNMLQDLARLSTSGFEPQDAELPEGPRRSVQALDVDGNELVSLMLVDAVTKFIVSSSSTPYIFQVPQFRADRLAPEPPDEG